MEKSSLIIIPLILGYMLDLIIGDPDHWPHPVRVFGNAIAAGDKWLNKNSFRFFKGMSLAVILSLATYLFFYALNYLLLSINSWLFIVVNSIWLWYGLANNALITEGRNVFRVLEKEGLEAGRKQLSRIVGRDTSQLTAQQIRIAVLETMSENLSDGVIAPLFFYAIGGIPAMMMYKMINTMDSMIGYRSEKYEQFGKFAARLDDVVNFIPARITALFMILVTGSYTGLQFILKYGNLHKSPNAGYPESALAGIMDCRFGGPNVYHGVLVEKPFIGKNDRIIEAKEIEKAVLINHKTCFLMVLVTVLCYFL
ncbi:adenosylcobinamide-phosphate synthase CbiB [Dyadobacter sp. LHD-138]|uniref:adenosylcobinamide-phosphate synthase CbiB n=1 Tax=Dyadobacter sp. LHD-138 TaxID=3071413 RepID=UPI0027E20C66|nr:adenosylcobinamide-phosphate synthase CbiB [Dyadobacter sp. LHD-138]MDQ6480267.1 adenosylcobinamide-phosphate synthase CbiB [Dyadobacter sp. LHD-138]